MPLVDITNPAIIKFLVESYDKTARLRMKWNNLHGDKLKLAATLTREEKGYYETDVLKKCMAGGMAAVKRDHIVAGYNRRRTPIRDGTKVAVTADIKKGYSIVDVGLGDPEHDPRLSRPDSDLSIDPIMRLVDPKQKKILYKNIPDYGKNVYLKHRSRLPPENKYYFRECSGWEYGWRLKDSYFGHHASSYGRVWRLTRDVKSRSGPHPDPDYYKNPDIVGVTKCS